MAVRRSSTDVQQQRGGGPFLAGGLNRSRGRSYDPTLEVKVKPVARFMLANEAIRLVLQQEPNHDLLTGKRQPIAPTHDRRHAHASASPQDTGHLSAHRA